MEGLKAEITKGDMLTNAPPPRQTLASDRDY